MSSSENDDDICFYCDELYSKSIDGWIKCTACKRWLITFVLALKKKKTIFICEFCS